MYAHYRAYVTVLTLQGLFYSAHITGPILQYTHYKACLKVSTIQESYSRANITGPILQRPHYRAFLQYSHYKAYVSVSILQELYNRAHITRPMLQYPPDRSYITVPALQGLHHSVRNTVITSPDLHFPACTQSNMLQDNKCIMHFQVSLSSPRLEQ